LATEGVWGAEPGPLVLSPENTVILEGPGSSGATLQYYLLRYYVGPAAAEAYKWDRRVDRSASAKFPLLRDHAQTKLPQGKSVLALGNSRFLSEADRQRLAASPGAVLVKRQGDAVLIAGDEAEATTEFLNRVAGIRFYAPDEIWTSRPRLPQMTVGSLEFFRPRIFATSWLAPYWPRNAEWVRMNPTIGRLSITCYHNLANIFPPEKYAKTHPEIYEMRGGQRRVPANLGTQVWNPCLSAPALPDLAMKHVRERMKKGHVGYIAMGMMDIAFDCECEACQKSVREHDGSYSNLYYGLLNEVARRCQKEFPGLLITSLLYSNARTPPVGLKIEPNIVVKVVTKTYRCVDLGALEAEKQRIRTFSDLGASWMIHDWCFSGVSPRSYLRQYAGFLQWAKQNRMIGAYVEYSPGESWYLDGAKYWILAQLLADPHQDVDLLWKQYCDDMFGPAGETMFRFFQHFQDKFVYAPDLIVLADLPRQEPAMHTPEDLAFQRGLLERAVATTKDAPLIQERLAKITRYFRAHELFAQATHVPHRLHWTFRGEGINRPLLAFYVNDDAGKLDEAIRYYHRERTVPPDDNYMDVRLGLHVSYVNNYTRGFAALLRTMRSMAVGEADLAKLDQAAVEQIVARSQKILRENLPQQRLKPRVQLFERILGKMLWIPSVDRKPAIDGNLGDEVWSQAAPLEDFTERDTLRRPVHETKGRVLRVGDRLIFALTCRQVGPIWAQSPKETLTGTHIWRESGVEIAFGPLPGPKDDAPAFAQYDINAFGAFRGFHAAKDNRQDVEVAVRLDKDKGEYVIEAALPLRAPGHDYTRHKALTLNVARMVYSGDSFESDVTLGWHPVFVTISDPASRGLVFFK
jgi:hypothetical protein